MSITEALWEKRCLQFLNDQKALDDPSHDELHIRRVVNNAIILSENEPVANRSILFLSAWLHDCVYIEKNDARRSQAAVISAEKAAEFLRSFAELPEKDVEEICHCIAAHSFSGSVEPQTLEAKILRDADRLDALGAIGIMRCFSVGARIGTAFYHPKEPFPDQREANDSLYSVDHFYEKLLGLHVSMVSEVGRKEAKRRTEFMRDFLSELGQEIGAQIS